MCDRCRQGLGQGVGAGEQPRRASESARCGTCPPARGAVAELAEHLLAEGIEKVTVESTSDYWRIWFYVLEAAGLSVQLVNARDVKNVPGRPKTDLISFFFA